VTKEDSKDGIDLHLQKEVAVDAKIESAAEEVAKEAAEVMIAFDGKISVPDIFQSFNIGKGLFDKLFFVDFTHMIFR